MEYAGYVPTDGLDIAGLTANLSKSIYGIGVQKQIKRAEMDKAKADADDLINSQQMTDSQDFNTLILKAADDGRGLLNKLNKDLKAGLIKPADYRERVNNIQKNWGILSTSAKTFDERYQEYIKRRQPNENGFIPAGAVEMNIAERFGKVAELANKNLVFNEKGGLYSVDATTGETWSIDALNKPENILSPRLNLPEYSKRITKDIAANITFRDLGKGGEEEIKSTLLNHGTAIELGVNSMVSNPKDAASLIADWGGVPIRSYVNDVEKNILRQEAVNELSQAKEQAGKPKELTKEELDRIELSLLKIEKDGNGMIIPALSEEQMKLAKDVARAEINSQLYTEVSGKAKQDWYHAPSGDGSGDGGNKKESSNLYEDLLAAWNISRGGTRDSALESESRFNALAEGKYEFKWSTGGIQVSKVSIDERTGRKSLIPIKGTVANLDALQKYFYPDKNLYDIEKSETLGKKKKVSETVGKKMVTFVLPDGQVGQVPEDKVNDFLKKNPKAKRK